MLGEMASQVKSARPRYPGFAEDPPAEFERPIVKRMTRPFRDAAFATAVKAAYGDTCAMTELKIINGGGRSEVQAAHIRPVAEAGPDLFATALRSVAPCTGCLIVA